MDEPELLLLFSNDGPVKVRVKLQGDRGRIADRAMNPAEVAALVAPGGQGFHERLHVDGYPVTVIGYEIDPAKNQLTVVAKLVSSRA